MTKGQGENKRLSPIPIGRKSSIPMRLWGENKMFNPMTKVKERIKVEGLSGDVSKSS